MADQFWGVDCRSGIGPTGQIRFLLYSKDAAGKITILHTRVSNIAPVENIKMLGDYDDASDWLDWHKPDLDAAVERLKKLPTAWDRINDS